MKQKRIFSRGRSDSCCPPARRKRELQAAVRVEAGHKEILSQKQYLPAFLLIFVGFGGIQWSYEFQSAFRKVCLRSSWSEQLKYISKGKNFGKDSRYHSTLIFDFCIYFILFIYC